MKKISIIILAAMAMVSCGNTYSPKQVELTSQADSLNFALGLINGLQLKQYQLSNDSSDATVAEFIDALQAGYDGKEEELSEAAQAGLNFGESIKASEEKGLAENPAWTLNEKLFLQGLVNGLKGDTTGMSVDEARAFFMTAYQAPATDAVAGKTIKGKCPSKVKAVELKSFTDSLNYAFGLLNGDQMHAYMAANDTTGEMVDEFIAHVNKGLKSKVKNPQLVNMGKQIGRQIHESESEGLLGIASIPYNFELIKQGFINGLYNDTEFMDINACQMYIQSTMDNLKYGETKEAGEKFLAENALREGVITTESGLQYEVLKMGKGKRPAATDRVRVHYHGTLIDGTVFDSSVDRGEPISFGLNQVIPGWTEGVQLMPIGSKFRFYIPQELGYGSRAAGSIPPYSTLIFEVELLDIEK